MKIEKKIALLAPIGDISNVTLRMLTWQKDQELTELAKVKGKIDPLKLSWLRMEAVSGLEAGQLDDMATPDINEIKVFLVSIITKPAAAVAEELGIEFEHSKDNLHKNLLQPLEDGTKSYKLRYPTGKLTKLLEQETDDDRRTFILCEFCTGLSELQLKSMSTPDWNSLQDTLDNFLQKTAAFFR
ncbi:MAG: hypothetical protein ACRC0U_09875 [Vibrio sp.]